jgi:hypothetical protein
VTLLSPFFYVLPAYSENELSEVPKITDELDEELRYLKAETYVITASKVMENIKKAPASITVITDRQIRQMGAKNLQDVISRAVPFFISSHYYMGIFLPIVRGGSEVLLMINNQPIYNAWSQNAWGQWAYGQRGIERNNQPGTGCPETDVQPRGQTDSTFGRQGSIHSHAQGKQHPKGIFRAW